jgi:hypothetical protein
MCLLSVFLFAVFIFGSDTFCGGFRPRFLFDSPIFAGKVDRGVDDTRPKGKPHQHQTNPNAHGTSEEFIVTHIIYQLVV